MSDVVQIKDFPNYLITKEGKIPVIFTHYPLVNESYDITSNLLSLLNSFMKNF